MHGFTGLTAAAVRGCGCARHERVPDDQFQFDAERHAELVALVTVLLGQFVAVESGLGRQLRPAVALVVGECRLSSRPRRRGAPVSVAFRQRGSSSAPSGSQSGGSPAGGGSSSGGSGPPPPPQPQGWPTPPSTGGSQGSTPSSSGSPSGGGFGRGPPGTRAIRHAAAAQLAPPARTVRRANRGPPARDRGQPGSAGTGGRPGTPANRDPRAQDPRDSQVRRARPARPAIPASPARAAAAAAVR